jgi:hypothetical protein
MSGKLVHVRSVVALFVVGATLLAGCTTVIVAPTQPPAASQPTGTQLPTAALPTMIPPVMATQPAAPGSTVAGEQALLPDPAADYTTGDTAPLSGGEFVGDQAELTVEQAVRVAVSGDEATYAFLVVITGRDDIGFHFNALNFQLIDDKAFQYDALIGADKQPELDFGDLGPGQQVRGWLSFEASSTTSTLQLQYSPVMALEPATFGFVNP